MNVAGQNKCRRIVSRKISLFDKMQGGRSPSFDLFHLDMYENNTLTVQFLNINKFYDLKSTE